MPVASTIEAIKTFIATYSALQEGSPLYVDFVGSGDQIQYGIVPQPGPYEIDQNIDGSKEMEFPFALQINAPTVDDAARIANSGWCEDFAEWLATQTKAGTLPTMETGKTPEKIEAVNHGYIAEEGESQTGFYQINCKLTYEQVA